MHIGNLKYSYLHAKRIKYSKETHKWRLALGQNLKCFEYQKSLDRKRSYTEYQS